LQKVVYSLRPRRPDLAPIEETLTYHMYDYGEAVEWLVAAGFSPNKVSTVPLPEWDYLIICAVKA
jgi:hypothetical protein